MNAVQEAGQIRVQIIDLLRTNPTTRTVKRKLFLRIGELERLVMTAHRAGFNEACDRLGAPPSDTPMERIALAGATND